MMLEEGAMGKVMDPYALSLSLFFSLSLFLSLTYPVAVVVDDDGETG